MREFHANGVVASVSLIHALQDNNNSWSRCVLSQCFKVPSEYAEALLAGEAEWQILNKSTIIIGLVKHSSQ
jgi:hypothetical protein